MSGTALELQTMQDKSAKPEKRLGTLSMLIIFCCVVVPLSALPLIIWALRTLAVKVSLQETSSSSPATISRAANDADVTSVMMVLVPVLSVLALFVCCWVAVAYWHTVNRYLAAGTRALQICRVTVPVTLAFQIIAIVGINVSTLFTLANNTFVHLAGSGVFFVVQSLTILISCSACAFLARKRAQLPVADDGSPALLLPMQRLRGWFGFVICLGSLTYMTLFFVKDFSMSISRQTLVDVYTSLEVAVVFSFLLYMVSFLPDLISFDQRRRSQRKA